MLLYDIYYHGNSVDFDTPLRAPTAGTMLAQCTNGDNSWLVNRAGKWVPISSKNAQVMIERSRGGDPIARYVVRCSGQPLWSVEFTLADARREVKHANAIAQPGHLIFAEHESGNVTGPYA